MVAELQNLAAVAARAAPLPAQDAEKARDPPHALSIPLQPLLKSGGSCLLLRRFVAFLSHFLLLPADARGDKGSEKEKAPVAAHGGPCHLFAGRKYRVRRLPPP